MAADFCGYRYNRFSFSATTDEMAKEKNPQWWSGAIRNWNPVSEIWLNPPKEIPTKE